MWISVAAIDRARTLPSTMRFRCRPELPDSVCVVSVAIAGSWFLVSGLAVNVDVFLWELRGRSVEGAPPVPAIMSQSVP